VPRYRTLYIGCEPLHKSLLERFNRSVQEALGNVINLKELFPILVAVYGFLFVDRSAAAAQWLNWLEFAFDTYIDLHDDEPIAELGQKIEAQALGFWNGKTWHKQRWQASWQISGRNCGKSPKVAITGSVKDSFPFAGAPTDAVGSMQSSTIDSYPKAVLYRLLPAIKLQTRE